MPESAGSKSCNTRHSSNFGIRIADCGMKKGARLRVQGIRYRELCDFCSVLYPVPCTLYLVPQFFRNLATDYLSFYDLNDLNGFNGFNEVNSLTALRAWLCFE